jgi:uncharacterized repeat protein (TIGR03837 family)
MPAWDIFCKVVDNFGDAGVCWRLARQLAEERGQAVRLWCDDLAVMAALCPQIDAKLASQRVHGLELHRWSDPFPSTPPADVVIEAFACELPAGYTAAMAERRQAPVWLNLEYLSAEDWVEDCHRRASPHPRLPLLKHFFFPGFAPSTGGLLREADLLERRDAFRREPAAMWAQLGLAPPRGGELSISLFSYENAALPSLLDQWAAGSQPIRCFVRPGRTLAQLASIIGADLAPGAVHRQGRLALHALPFVAQEEFDPLLWACDVNFVRGEDSFVRAQWAARPLVWHIYPQEDEAHRLKLAAFLDRYCADLPEDAARACQDFWECWNHATTPDWIAFWHHHETLARHAAQWSDRLAGEADLVSSLAEFVQVQLK